MEIRNQQIAIFGASNDIASDEEIYLAKQSGELLAKCGFSLLVGGDDGVMGAAAHAAKNCGGTVIAVVAREKEIRKHELFDVIINTGLGWVQFSDVLVRSSIGAFIIGGGAGTIGELSLMYLNQFPCAFVGSRTNLAIRFGNKPLDVRALNLLPVFDTPFDALQYILEDFHKEKTEPTTILTEAWDLHCTCYPFGDSGEYLNSALGFQKAISLSLAHDKPQFVSVAQAHYHDAIGDHFYYHVQDYFRAASHYSKALQFSSKMQDEKDEEFRGYLRAIILECLALGLEQVEQFDAAIALYTQAATYYRLAQSSSSAESQDYLEHSATGLEGDIHRINAIVQLRKGLHKNALSNVHEAQKKYEEALSLLPRWGNSNLSDTYSHYTEKLNSIKAKIEEANKQGG